MPLNSLALQLYSVRHDLEKDIPGTIARVAQIGYTQVEASYRVLSPRPELLDAIQANNLISPTMTSPLMNSDRDAVFTMANRLGAKTVVETATPADQWTSVEGISAIADELNAAAEQAAGYGLAVAYHNHQWEIDNRFDGRTGLEVLADHLAPEVLIEVDAYWAAVGGEDVPALLKRLHPRVRYLHLKDGPINDDDTQQVATGNGKMRLWEIIDAVPGLEGGIIELDDFTGDVWEAVADSFTYMSSKVTA